MKTSKQPTPESATLLAALLNAQEESILWIFRQLASTFEPEQIAKFTQILDHAHHDLPNTPALDELAKDRLLEDVSLSSGEKVLLAALVLSELYEIVDFHSRQITETLKQNSNPIGNITSALTGLINRGEVEIADSTRAAPNSHKRYRLTQQGLTAAKELAAAPTGSRSQSGNR